jgi:hypothetical protein
MLMRARPHMKRLGVGRKAKFPEIEQVIVAWVKRLRREGKQVTRYMLQLKAKELAKRKEWIDKYPDIRLFTFTHKWVDGLMTRNNLSNRRRTTIAQRLPEDLIEKQHEFLSFVLCQRIQNNYDIKFIGNMDETPLTIDLPGNLTIDECGTRTVNIRTTGHERSHFTVVLTCMADGMKLPPLIIFKLKNVPRANFPSDVFVRANPSGWMNEIEMAWWIDNIWTMRAPFSKPQSLLVMDSFSAHITDSAKRHLIEQKTNIAIIPGGLTSRLQPLDVAVNRSFKAKVRFMLLNEFHNELID